MPTCAKCGRYGYGYYYYTSYGDVCPECLRKVIQIKGFTPAKKTQRKAIESWDDEV